jgi:hypothetical protein
MWPPKKAASPTRLAGNGGPDIPLMVRSAMSMCVRPMIYDSANHESNVSTSPMATSGSMGSPRSASRMQRADASSKPNMTVYSGSTAHA